MAVWGISMPLYTGPDEQSQATHAAALVRGQLIGTPGPGYENAFSIVSVPGTFGDGLSEIHCFQWNPAVPASCAAGVKLPDTTVLTTTYSGRYPPVYYAITGLVTLVDQSAGALRYMRLVSALMSAALLGLAIMAMLTWSRNRLLRVGFLCALTPTAVYLGGMLNPNGLEIAAAICLWVTGTVLVFEHGDDPPRGLLLCVVGSAAVFATCRGLSPLLVFLILVALVALLGFRRAWRLLRERRDVQLLAAALFVVSAATVVWILLAHALWLVPAGPTVPPHASELRIVGLAFAQTRLWYEQMVGVLGWDEVFMPSWTYRIWAAVIIVLVALAIRSGRARGLVVLGSLVAVVVLLPIPISLVHARTLGIVWQGRYTLPLSAGVPILASALGNRSSDSSTLWIRLVLFLALALASLLAFLETLRRYAVGNQGPFDLIGARWHPVEGWALALLWYLVAYGLLLVVLGALESPRRERAAQAVRRGPAHARRRGGRLGAAPT
ncbi:MAG: DUF2142 domain-containing protein [Acidimicrobiales bacterium]